MTAVASPSNEKGRAGCAPHPALQVVFPSADHSQVKDGVNMRKNLSKNVRRGDFLGGQHKSLSRKWFAALLWRAFPAASNTEVARLGAPVLGVSERQITNWLNCENDAALSYVTAVMVLAGVECALDGVRGGRAA
ncbi:hypothetical protein [uncultured Pseudosulfitobacter sp.]|uniref:hypothetical protein n=1 Tax=uncultured Pseudosulfitobacter sp. TaxID=2854214 RepID=UPI0030DC5B0F|tara:strand:+ start:983 stop:1387 length:405 start_codon:yes stop_codon:yes gene_type:complete